MYKVLFILSQISAHSSVELTVQQFYITFVGHPQTSKKGPANLIDVANDDGGEVDILERQKKISDILNVCRIHPKKEVLRTDALFRNKPFSTEKRTTSICFLTER